MEFSANQVRVYENSGVCLYEKIELEQLEKDYHELLELIELFSYKDTKEHNKLLYCKRLNINKHYKHAIREAKRVLKNTEKCIKYNASRV
jgi:hypothetical protein